MNEISGLEAANGGSIDFDVLIVGAGISGIDAAYHLQQRCPGMSFAMIEKQAGFGGTWRTHRYPGIRSDSDLYTFGFSWKPWTGVPIATAPEILKYLDEAMVEQDLHRHVRYGRHVQTAEWDGNRARWTLRTKDTQGAEEALSCRFLWMCQGYYRHEEGYIPDYPGIERFEGQLVHPQTWPDALDYAGKRVVVIGSGATAATIVPAMAGSAEHVTMLQRSPTYFYAKPVKTELAKLLEPLDLPAEWTHEIMRRRYIYDSQNTVRRSFEEPDALREDLLRSAQHYLGPDYPLDPHFTPNYRPWRQRLAMIPDGDLFRAISRGEASVVTDRIESFTETGIRLASGEELAADIVVSATGFHLEMMGGIPFFVDGREVDWAKTWAHRGIMFSGVPNMAWSFGYLRAAWTLRADLISDFVCRLLLFMAEQGADTVLPQLRSEDRQMPALPFVDPQNFNPGYIQRKAHLLPKQGDRQPWIFSQDYLRESEEIPKADLEDGTLIYSRAPAKRDVALN